jgi:diaminopimelate epimerase
MTTTFLAPKAPSRKPRTSKVQPPDRTSRVRLFRADTCRNSFLILLGEAAAVEEAAARVVGQADRSTFDSVLAISFAPGAGVLMRVLEQDGSESAMCGNGALAVGRLLDRLGLTRRVLLRDGTELMIERTADGLYSVPMRPLAAYGDFLLSVAGDFPRFQLYRACGEPHAVAVVPSVQDVDLDMWGWATVPRANCTVVSRCPDGRVFARTFERGVNRETPSCGTGATSAAQILLSMDAKRHGLARDEEVVHVCMKGGTLRIRAVRGKGSFLEGLSEVWEWPGGEVVGW